MTLEDALAIHAAVIDDPGLMAKDEYQQAFWTAQYIIEEHARECVKKYTKSAPGRWFPARPEQAH